MADRIRVLQLGDNLQPLIVALDVRLTDVLKSAVYLTERQRPLPGEARQLAVDIKAQLHVLAVSRNLKLDLFGLCDELSINPDLRICAGKRPVSRYLAHALHPLTC